MPLGPTVANATNGDASISVRYSARMTGLSLAKLFGLTCVYKVSSCSIDVTVCLVWLTL